MLRDLVRVEPPAETPITLIEAKAAARVETGDDDALITGYIEAAVDHLDGYAGILGRAVVEQTWMLHLSRFPACVIELPLPPLIGVEEITYIDPAGDEQVLSPAAYTVIDGPISEVRRVSGQVWPATFGRDRAVSVTFTCGYGGPADVPGAIKAALQMMVADFYAFRETAVTGTIAAKVPMSTAVESLLRAYRVPRL